ncbi:putative reverse transcriptase domain-containing protein [Tanacetum coccineum]
MSIIQDRDGDIRVTLLQALQEALVPLDEIEIDENLRFVKEPIEIVERDVKKLKRRRIPLVKVRWNSRQGAECCNLSLEDKALQTGGDCAENFMPPEGLKKKSIKAVVEKRVAKGVVGLRRWIEKVEQVFETCKCAEEDKVMFVASTFEGRVLTWWNGNVHTLGLVNANHIPWTEFKTMMTTEYCPATEIQRMEQELWTLTLKGDDIEAYNNRKLSLLSKAAKLYMMAGGLSSFVSSAFTPFIDIAPTALNTSYEVELADGKAMDGCHTTSCIDCYEKIVRIPLPNGETLEVQGERPKKDPGLLTCIKADEKKLDDIQVVRDFPEVFPDDLSGLPPVREIDSHD